jgi:tetratricopeptide (TPR) repeat protein
MFSSGPSFSPHNDVLNATPSTDTEKFSLVEELKRRGRLSVTSQRYPDAKELYGKAIEVLSSIVGDYQSQQSDLAVLYSNRSLCYLQMNQPTESYDDATSATCYDPTYVKGYWRLGQACMALKKKKEAIEAYKSALLLDESNKALEKELNKAEKQLVKDQEEAVRLEKERNDKSERDDASFVSKSAVNDKVSPKSTATSVSHSTSNLSSSANDSSASDKMIMDDLDDQEGEFSKSDHVRGYKIVNGKKTSFFHHEQTEEEKRLIGDIAPKRIEPNQMPVVISSMQQDKDVSAWNKAGTWEEKDVTDWAMESIRSKVMEASYYKLPEGSPDPDASIKIVDISKLISSKHDGGSAHASVAKVRGKKRYIFEFNICIHWEMTLGNGHKCKGSMTFYDVDGTHEIGEGYDVSEYTVEDCAPADARHLLERFVRDGGLRTKVEEKLDEWILLFRETY